MNAGDWMTYYSEHFEDCNGAESAQNLDDLVQDLSVPEDHQEYYYKDGVMCPVKNSTKLEIS